MRPKGILILFEFNLDTGGMKSKYTLICLTLMSSIAHAQPDVWVDRQSAVKPLSTRVVREIPDRDFEMYFLKGGRDGFFMADPQQAVCTNYQSFRDFLVATEFKKLDKAPDDVIASAYGDVFSASGRSCAHVVDELAAPGQISAAMNYRVVVYSSSGESNALVREYVQSVNGREFFGNKIEFQKVDHIHCRWWLDTHLQDEHLGWVDFMSIERELRGINRKFITLDQLLKAHPAKRAVEMFLSQMQVRSSEMQSVLTSVEKADRMVLTCRMDVVSGFKSYPTFFGRLQEFTCESGRCSLLAP